MGSNKTNREVPDRVALPLSNESVKKKRNHLLKSMVGASVIATGLVMMPQATFAQVAEQPVAIVQKEAVAAPSASTTETPSASATETTSASESEAPATEAATETKAGTADAGEKKNDVAEVAAVDRGADASNAAPVAQGSEGAVESAEPSAAEPASVPDTNLETSEEKPSRRNCDGRSN